MRIFLLTLPFFSPSEPPGQLALLKSLWQEEQQEQQRAERQHDAKQEQQQECSVFAFDGNVDFLDYVLTGKYVLARLAALSKMEPPASRWTRAKRAYLHVDRARAALKMEEGYRSFTRYRTFVHYLNDALKLVFAPYPDILVSLNNFQLLPYAPVDLANNLIKARQGLAASAFASSVRQGFCSGCQQGPCSPFDEWCFDRLFPRVEQHKPDLMAFSLTYLSQVFPTFYISARLKERFPRLRMVIGGGLLNCYRDRPQSLSVLHPLFDRIILGRAAPLSALAAAAKEEASCGSDGPCIDTGDELTDVPAPDYSDFDLSGYFSPVPVLPYATSLGCYWNKCAFCPDAGKGSYVCGSKGLARNLRKTLTAYPKALFHFTDPSMPPANMEIIADLFAEYSHASYYSFVRFESRFDDSAFMKKLAASGCRMLQFGLESASKRLLSLSRKGIDLTRARRILELSAREGILNYVYLLFGLPSETEEDRQKTMQFIAENQAVVHFINPALMNLPIGSPMEQEPDRFFIDRTYDLAGVSTPDAPSENEANEAGGVDGVGDVGDVGDVDDVDDVGGIDGSGKGDNKDATAHRDNTGNIQDPDSQQDAHARHQENEACSFSLYKGFTSNGENIRPKARRFLEKVFSTHPLVALILKNDPPFFRAGHAPFFRRKGKKK
ncbi:MAG: B12-binding domain-containing radical SAM protein [bacterium]